MDIGSRIKSLLDAKEMNQMMLAKLLNKPPVYVHNILKKKTLDTGKLKEIADVLEVPIMYFFEDGNITDGEHRDIVRIFEKQIKLFEELMRDVKSIKREIEENYRVGTKEKIN